MIGYLVSGLVVLLLERCGYGVLRVLGVIVVAKNLDFYLLFIINIFIWILLLLCIIMFIYYYIYLLLYLFIIFIFIYFLYLFIILIYIFLNILDTLNS